MRVQMRATAAGPNGVYTAGSVVDVPEEDAKRFIEAKAAVQVGNVLTRGAQAVRKAVSGRRARYLTEADLPDEDGDEDEEEPE